MKSRNIELTVLKALGIIVVVSCHSGVNLFNMIGIPISLTTELFPEYSYHMPLFIFASGYFYKRIYESNLLELGVKRFPSLIKYEKCNLFYFLLCFILIDLGFLSRDINFTFKSLLIEPFLGGFQFYFNGPAWFVPFLFLLQIIFTGIRKVIGLKFDSFRNGFDTNLRQESIFLVILIVIGFISASLSNIYPVINDSMNMSQSFLRILFGLQFFQLGFFYKEFLEKKVNLSYISFLIVVIFKIIVYLIFGYYTFSLRTIKFNNHSMLPFVVSILGIVYCLHLVKFIISIGCKINSRIISVICIIGDNTWSIMMHHLLIKWCLSGIYDLKILPNSLSVAGNYLISPILCIILPIVFAYLYDSLLSSLQNQDKSIAIFSLNNKG